MPDFILGVVGVIIGHALWDFIKWEFTRSDDGD